MGGRGYSHRTSWALSSLPMQDVALMILVVLTTALIAIVVDRVGRSKRRKSPPLAEVSSTVEQAFVDQFVTENPLDRITRQRDEYFHLIERIEQERNQWVEMWRTQAAEHQTAQALLGEQLGKTRQVAARAIYMLNELRKKHKLEPIDGPTGLVPYDGEPVFEPEKYAFRMLEMRDRLADPTDAVAARDAIDVEFYSESGDEDENP